jgi:hypothetical protein
MPIPLSYSYGNLLAWRLTTFLTATGMAIGAVGRESEAHPAFNIIPSPDFES